MAQFARVTYWLLLAAGWLGVLLVNFMPPGNDLMMQALLLQVFVTLPVLVLGMIVGRRTLWQQLSTRSRVLAHLAATVAGANILVHWFVGVSMREGEFDTSLSARVGGPLYLGVIFAAMTMLVLIARHGRRGRGSESV